jgi:hypothetical protein
MYFFLPLLFLFSQSGAQLAPVASKWVYAGRNISNGTYFHNEYKITGDTLLNGKKYSAIGKNGRKNDCYMRDENGKVYYYQHGEDLLFFDFTSKMGDTIFVDYQMEYNSDSIIKHFPVRIDTVYYSITTPHDSLRAFQITAITVDGRFVQNNIITEKVLFGPEYIQGTHVGPTLFQEGFEYEEKFKCYHEPNGISVELVADCDKVGLNEIVDVNDYIKVCPNPANHTLNVTITDSRAKLAQILLFDISGAELKKIPIEHSSNSYKIQTEHLISGTYFVVIELQSGERAVKKVFIQN